MSTKFYLFLQMNVSALGCMNSLIKWLLKLSVLLLLGTWCDKVAERSDAHWKSSNEVAYRITERMRKENAREIGGFFDKYRIGRLGLRPTWYCKYKTLLQAAKFNNVRMHYHVTQLSGSSYVFTTFQWVAKQSNWQSIDK